MRYMFYFWMFSMGQTSPSFVATDGVFSMCLAPLPRNEHLAGLPEDLLELVREAVTAGGSESSPSPVMPVLIGHRVAMANVLPEQMVIHRYDDEVAFLRPCLSTLHALDADPIAWANRESKIAQFRIR